VPTNYLVFIDDFFTLTARDRNQVLDGLIENLSLVGPRDRMAVVAFDGRKIEMISNWTNSHAQLRSAFEVAKGRPTRGLRIEAILRDFDANNRLDAGAATGASSAEARACPAVQQFEKFLERATLGVTATLRSFAGPPGRKVMMLLSGGWPTDAYEYILGPTPGNQRTGECGYRGAEILAPMHEVANLIGYTFYPIDVPGRSSALLANASEADDVALARTGPGIGGGVQQVVPPSIREGETQITLHRLAKETGGRAILDADRLDSFERVYEDTRSYYWLGFVPDWQGDDENHKIKLEVLKPGLEIRYREGYQDLSRDKEIGFLVESALMFGELPGSYPLHVELGQPSRGRRKVELPMLIRIPMDAVTMLPVKGRYVAELELRIGALDENGDRNEISTVPVQLAGSDPPPPGSYATYELAVKLRKEPQDLVFTLRDPATDTLMAAVTRFEP
jgi:VWFA-related protein